jgi:hypothetical protein
LYSWLVSRRDRQTGDILVALDRRRYIDARVAAQEHDAYVGAARARATHQLDAVEPRHPGVADHYIGASLTHHREQILGAGLELGVVTGLAKTLGGVADDQRAVIDDEDLTLVQIGSVRIYLRSFRQVTPPQETVAKPTTLKR